MVATWRMSLYRTAAGQESPLGSWRVQPAELFFSSRVCAWGSRPAPSDARRRLVLDRRVSGLADAEVADLLPQHLARDAEQLGRLRAVPRALVERADDVLALRFLEDLAQRPHV